MHNKTSLILTILALLLIAVPVPAAVEIGWQGSATTTIEDVYQREGTSFIAIDDVLTALELEGEWDSVAHVFRIRTRHGWAVISPGSQFLKVGDNFVPISHRPQFIDSKLRVSEDFLLNQLAPLLAGPIRYLNSNPSEPSDDEDPLDRLFAFLLRRQPQTGDSSQRIVAIDPAHGGIDNGAIGLEGKKEKVVTLEVAQRLERLLKMHQDAPVVMTRDADYALDAEARLQTIAQSGADVLLSLHAQSFAGPHARGVMLFVQSASGRDTPQGLGETDASRRLAEALGRTLKTAGFHVAGIAEHTVLPLGRGDLPRVLVEMGALSNPDDLRILSDPTRQQDLARALFDGLQAFLKDDKESINEFSSPQTQ